MLYQTPDIQDQQLQVESTGFWISVIIVYNLWSIQVHLKNQTWPNKMNDIFELKIYHLINLWFLEKIFFNVGQYGYH